MKINYRPEIDGLRAIAVLSVILYHSQTNIFNHQFFRGGFVGVDIFFVISGYLITSIILKELIATKTFSFKNFYERRIRRILPALLFMMLITLPLAWIFMLPYQLKEYGYGLISISLFSSNILFWKKINYFSDSSDLNPLIHTWSLSIEEQFYFLFPIAFLIFWKIGKKILILSIILLIILSLFLTAPVWKISDTASFYLLPTRAWELAMGSMCAFYPRKISSSHKKNSINSFIGFVMILICIFFFDENFPHPSFYTLLPTVGSALIIIFANQKTAIGILLSTKLIVGIGIISYSSYLWHQPLFAFAKLQNTFLINNYYLLGLSAFSLIIGFLSWKYIEKPFRYKNNFTRKQIFSFGFMGSLFFIIVGIIIYLQNGFINRFSSTDLHLAVMSPKNMGRYIEGKFNKAKHRSFKSHKYKILIVGDSYAQDTFNVLSENIDLNKTSLSSHWIRNACGIVISKKNIEKNIPFKFKSYCKSNPRFETENVKKLIQDADMVILSANWRLWVVNLLPETINQLKNIGAKKVVVIGGKNFGKIKIKKYFGLDDQTRVNLKNTISDKFFKIDKLMENGKYEFININQIFCSNNKTCSIFTPDAKLISFDGGHLTPAGTRFLGKKILKNSLISDIPR